MQRKAGTRHGLTFFVWWLTRTISVEQLNWLTDQSFQQRRVPYQTRRFPQIAHHCWFGFLKEGSCSTKQLHPNRTWDNSLLVLTWSLGRIHWSLRYYRRIPGSRTDVSHELGWSKKEKLRGVCSLHRRDAYPNTSTNSWDGDLVVQGSVGTKTVLGPG